MPPLSSQFPDGLMDTEYDSFTGQKKVMESPTMTFKFSYSKFAALSCHGLMMISSPAALENKLKKRAIHNPIWKFITAGLVIVSGSR